MRSPSEVMIFSLCSQKPATQTVRKLSNCAKLIIVHACGCGCVLCVTWVIPVLYYKWQDLTFVASEDSPWIYSSGTAAFLHTRWMKWKVVFSYPLIHGDLLIQGHCHLPIRQGLFQFLVTSIRIQSEEWSEGSCYIHVVKLSVHPWAFPRFDMQSGNLQRFLWHAVTLQPSVKGPWEKLLPWT